MDLLDYFKTGRTVKTNPSYGPLSDKYKPLTCDDFLENTESISKIHEWFHHLDTKNILVIIGPTGCGKTTLVDLICAKYEKTKFVSNSSLKRTKKELNSYYDKIKGFVKNGMLILDEFENILSKNESISVNEISKWFSIEYIPIIIICQSHYFNKIQYICNHSLSTTIFLSYPKPNTILRACLSILDQEEFEYTEAYINLIMKSIITMKCDVRGIFDCLCILNEKYEICEKSTSMDIYDTYRSLFDKDVPLQNKMNNFCLDAGTIPIIIQENYIDTTLSSYDKAQLCERMSLGDLFHKQHFLYTSSMNLEIYGCMSSIFTEFESFKDTQVFTNPRFGLIWTKQSAMYQKRKYLIQIQHMVNTPFINIPSMYMISSSLKSIIHEYKKCKNDTDIIKFKSFYNIDNKDMLYDIYISFQFKTDKLIPRKTFLNLVQKSIR